MKKILTILCCAAILFTACNKDEDPQPTANNNTTNSGPNVIFKLYFDSTLARLDNFGNPAVMPAGHSAQSPRFNKMSAHYIEFAQDITHIVADRAFTQE